MHPCTHLTTYLNVHMLQLYPQGDGIWRWCPYCCDHVQGRCCAGVSASAATSSLCSLPSDRTVRPRDEGEEAEGPVREQDLRETYIQLVRGVQEWPDGCVYRGEFGLNMKLGYGEFSWPTGEVSGLDRCSHDLPQGPGAGPLS